MGVAKSPAPPYWEVGPALLKAIARKEIWRLFLSHAFRGHISQTSLESGRTSPSFYLILWGLWNMWSLWSPLTSAWPQATTQSSDIYPWTMVKPWTINVDIDFCNSGSYTDMAVSGRISNDITMASRKSPIYTDWAVAHNPWVFSSISLHTEWNCPVSITNLVGEHPQIPQYSL